MILFVIIGGISISIFSCSCCCHKYVHHAKLPFAAIFIELLFFVVGLVHFHYFFVLRSQSCHPLFKMNNSPGQRLMKIQVSTKINIYRLVISIFVLQFLCIELIGSTDCGDPNYVRMNTHINNDNIFC